MTIDLPREFDGFVIRRELGRGAKGRVYFAEDTILCRPVVVTFIEHTNPGERQRFLLAVRSAAQIQHPNVVSIYRIAVLDGRPYFLTELVRGVSLAVLDKPVPRERALAIATGLARGLAAVHCRNLVLCSLKPSDVMIDNNGLAKIIDFGLARLATDGAAAVQAPVGTPDYMAPEVWSGAAPTCRSDVYSLGALLFELVAGTPPFNDFDSTELAHRVTTSEAPALRERTPDVDPVLAEVVARCLRRDPVYRFADGDELCEALDREHASRRLAAHKASRRTRGWRWPWR